MKTFLLPLLLMICASRGAITARAQSIYEPYTFSKFAGLTGASGSDDGVTNGALFNQPGGVAVDSAGNVYVADTSNHTIRKVTPGGVVSTLAGLAGSIGSADGTGGAARFHIPLGVAVDSAGNIYVADTGNETIRKITSAGVVSTMAGLAGDSGSADGAGSAARFDYPAGLAVDSAGNIYVADSNNSTIRKITPAGVVNTLAGLAGNSGSADGTGSAARFTGPMGVAVDSAGNVYVTDTFNNTIRKITSAGVVSTMAGLAGNSGSADGTGSAARFDFPIGATVDSAGNVYVADSNNSTIRKITSAGAVSTLAGLAGNSGNADGTGSAARFRFSRGVAVDSAGSVYVADTGNSTIRKITPAGVVSTMAGLAARFNFPYGVAVDSAGNTYVADSNNHTIRKITPADVVSTLAGLAGNPGTSDGTGNGARFHNPYGVAADSAGNVYAADSGNHAIRKITSAGVVTTLAGLAGTSGSADGSGSAARFSSPESVAADNTGNVYVADYANHTIRKITPAGMVSTLAGLAGNSGSADGTGSAARFNFPIGVAVNNAGNVYVADFNNCTIRKVTSAGVVSTLAGFPLSAGSADDTGSAARFNFPGNVAVDNASNVYVADTGNQLIRKVNSAGVVRTLAGLAGNAGAADGAANVARFNNPYGVAVDTDGKVYVADTFNHTIRRGTLPVQVLNAVSHKMHGGVSGDIDLPQTGNAGIECRSGGASNVHQVVMSFATAVTVTSASATPDPLVSGATGSVTGYSVSGAQVTVDLSGVSNAQTILINLFGVSDGTYTNNVSVPMSVLLGDTTGNGSANATDVSLTKSKSGQAVDATNFRTDVTVSNSINATDVSTVKLKTGTALP